MKLFSFKTIFVFVFRSIILTSAIAAQENNQALKFDEFVESSESSFTAYRDELSITERAKRFGIQFRKERGAKAYVIYYQGRISDNNLENLIKRKIDQIKSDISVETDYSNENVLTIDGGYREKTTIEFWIVPKNAEPPAPTPTIDKSETTICPAPSIYSENPINEPDVLRFVLSTYDLKKIVPEYTLTWKISGGEIIGEQRLDVIKVKLNNGVERATAYVEVNGLPYPCPKVFSATAEFNGKLHLTDEFGREPNGQIKARLDSYHTQLQNNPTATGYIIIYGSRQEGKKISIGREKLIRSHFAFRNIDTSRITFVDGGFREDVATELWLSFDENQKPVPTPTVNERFVGTSKPLKKPRRSKTLAK